MFDWILEAIWSAVRKFAEWITTVFVWVWEWLYSFVNEFLGWLFESSAEYLQEIIQSIKPHIPAGVVENIVSAYDWLQYINDWVPVKYAITLFLAYFAIKYVLVVGRWVKSCIPFIG